jgi:hypothetical protein
VDYLDHYSWGRPEDMTMARPAQAITPSSPGSELAAETAAAMAASAILFKTANPGKSNYLTQFVHLRSFLLSMCKLLINEHGPTLKTKFKTNFKESLPPQPV